MPPPRGTPNPLEGPAIMYMRSILDSDPAERMRVLTTNVFGPYLVVRALLPLLLEGESKTIITVASVGAHLVTPSLSAYQISKLAVLRLTGFICAEHGDDGVVAYSVHPGNVPTDMGGDLDDLPPVYRPVFVDTRELSAGSLVFLASERRPWLAGRYINLTWDLPELMAKEEEIVQGDKLKVRLVV